jgi:hypothetical protein
MMLLSSSRSLHGFSMMSVNSLLAGSFAIAVEVPPLWLRPSLEMKSTPTPAATERISTNQHSQVVVQTPPRAALNPLPPAPHAAQCFELNPAGSALGPANADAGLASCSNFLLFSISSKTTTQWARA